ncbi:MAG: phytanoyl-CoA dioxygenase family protein [Sideroxydans sp.]|nr:phytanoyl-CoA dioxygenase family protein [Sideroxydans sp.]
MSDASEILTTGNLGIFHLKRLWEKSQGTLRGEAFPELVAHEGELDHLVLNCVGLDIVEPYQFLFHQQPTFAEFESWIVKTLGAVPSPEVVAKTNRAVTRFMAGNFRNFPAAEKIEHPVLTPEEMKFWDENGYVVLKNAISREDAKASEQVVWDFLGLAPDKPEAWYGRSQIFWADLFQHPVLNRNRSSARIHKAFAQIWGAEDLVASVDRVSFNPPIKESINHSGPSRLHWDTSIAVPLSFDVLGILYLNDVAENQGAFRCIPGFHRKIDSWIASLPENVNPRDVNLEDRGVVSIGGNAGDMVIWRQELPHGSGRNLSNIPRLAQYITMYPPDRDINPVWK